MMNSPVSFMGNNPMKDKELENKWHSYYANLQQEEEEDINDPRYMGYYYLTSSRVVKTSVFVKTCNFFVEIVAKKAKMGVFTPNKILALFT